MSRKEKVLDGGNMSATSTDGEYVYKDAKPQSPTIHRLLNHLHNKGFTSCPQPFGFDDKGREVLSYVEGETIEDYPQSNALETKINTIQEAAILLKKYHDATIDFEESNADIWFLSYQGDLDKEVICHNDYAPYNVTFKDCIPIGIIDFDTACPAPRVWDIAYAIYRFVPLSQSIYDVKTKQYRQYDRKKDAKERKILINEFLNAYDIHFDIKKVIIERLNDLVSLFDEECKKGSIAFIRMKEEGHQDFYIKEIAFINKEYEYWI